VKDGKITKTYTILDLLDVMRQAGLQLVPNSLGEEGLVPGPMTQDGVLLVPQDEGEGQRTLDLATTMCAALAADYDGVDIKSIRLERFWDSERMMWYGPSGIGTTRALKGFQDNHQRPWKQAFPDSAVRSDLIAELGEGNYAAWTGRMLVSHNGMYLGCPPTGNPIKIRVMDWWRREGDLLVENWVLIDMIHLGLQLGLDVLGTLCNQSRQR
jgi:predicted ester cyclase